jgi:hypothetical protein
MRIYDIYPDLGRLTQSRVREYLVELKLKFEENEPLATVLIQETPIWQGMRSPLVGLGEMAQKKMLLEAEQASAKPPTFCDFFMTMPGLPPEFIEREVVCDVLLRLCVDTRTLARYCTLNKWQELA